MSEQTTAPAFEEWAIVELMGHRRLAGKVTQAEMFGTALMRLDVYPGDAEQPTATQFYGGSSIYCLTPTTESVCRRFAKNVAPEPVTKWDLAEKVLPPASTARDDEDDFDDEPGEGDGRYR